MTPSQLFLIGALAYLGGLVAHSLAGILERPSMHRAGRGLVFFGAVVATTGLGIRATDSGGPPLILMHETLISLSTLFIWVTLGFALLEVFPLFEAAAAAIGLFSLGIAFLFPRSLLPPGPDLQSPLLYLHVPLALLGEVCFAVAFLFGYLYCCRRLIEGIQGDGGPAVGAGGNADAGSQASRLALSAMPVREKLLCLLVVMGPPLLFLVVLGYVWMRLGLVPAADVQRQWLLFGLFLPALVLFGLVFFGLFLVRGAIGKLADRWLPCPERLDELNFRAIALGYPLFVIGAVLGGMVWAQQAWGRYWGWDPKEVWSLVTVLVYSVYLHLRSTGGWRGTDTALMATLGFLVTLFSLFGVNLLSQGLHTYVFP